VTRDTNIAERTGATGSRVPSWVWGAAAFVALAIAVYHDMFATLWRTWGDNPNYSHGYLIPPVTALLLLRVRKEFAGARGRGSVLGLVVIVAALAGHLLSIRAGVFMTQGYSFVLLLLGCVVFLFGTGAFKLTWFPIGYLVFMLPMPPIFIDEASFRLKVFAAKAGSAIAHRLGIPLARTGMTIHLPAGSLRIADPCSGLRSLIALVAHGALFAYLTEGPLWKRVVLFLCAIPLAVLANIVRISVLCAVANAAGIDAALGFFHDFSGLLLFVIALVGLAVVRKLLRIGDSGRETA